MVLPVQPPETVGWPEEQLGRDRHQGFDDRRRAPVADGQVQHGRHARSRRQAGLRPRALLARLRPVFHAPWEKRVNALYSLAVRLGIFNMDEYRHAIERMEPRHYLAASYYERSLTSLATLCVEKGIVTREELERRAGGVFPLALPSAPGRSNAPTRERFKPGDRVRVRHRPRARPRAHAGLHSRQERRGGQRIAAPIPSPTRTRTACRPPTSRPTTCVSRPRSSGPTRPTRPWCMSPCSRATWNARHQAAH